MSTPQPTPVNPDISIVIVDDARFTLEMLRRVLRQSGYTDVRVATRAERGLEMLNERTAQLLLADWMMPGTDGLALTRRVRQLDEDNNRYTFVLLLTAQDDADQLEHAFEQGVDDIVIKSADNTELLARVRAAARIAYLQNELLMVNARVRELTRQTDRRNSFDLATGVGNRGFMERQLQAVLRHVDARGGAACLCVVRIHDFARLAHRHGERVAEELLEITARRLNQSVRPLDVVARLSEHDFGLLMHQERAEQCHPGALQRIQRALNLRPYRTSSGYIPITVNMAMCTLDKEAAAKEPVPGDIVQHLLRQLREHPTADTVQVAQWPNPRAAGKPQ